MTKKIETIPIAMIDPPKRPSRININDAETIELAESIRAIGQILPIIVKKVGERYEIVAGHRRWLAHQILAMTEIDALVRDDDEESLDLVKATENILRENLSQLEEARDVKTLLDKGGYSIPQLSKMLGKSESWIRARLDLLTWPADFLEAIQSKAINLAVGNWLVRIDDPEYRSYLLQCAVKNGITSYTAQAWFQHWAATKEVTPEENLPEGEKVRQAPQEMHISIPCFRCGKMTRIEDLVVCRICQACYGEVTEG